MAGFFFWTTPNQMKQLHRHVSRRWNAHLKSHSRVNLFITSCTHLRSSSSDSFCLIRQRGTFFFLFFPRLQFRPGYPRRSGASHLFPTVANGGAALLARQCKHTCRRGRVRGGDNLKKCPKTQICHFLSHFYATFQSKFKGKHLFGPSRGDFGISPPSRHV